ncbi:hypothetical protein LWC33_29520 [Pseudonocardia sp. RS11V-5]|uniref:hypothetical protein n=1 Tax=Pseudonocardia terrae TaxID=2905831 RepID=UPI001E3868FB|nr:hypothetical protein [Pseudonocardia terrae]MCE3555571.1 hypothetical protein [Pseudonocardia terrae]
MTESTRIDDLPAALADRQFPTVGVWNRLEGRPRTIGFDRALSAEVRDPLWLLTRQWQMGELLGQDAGSPVTVTYSIGTSTPSRFRPGVGQEPIEDLPSDRPLETLATRRRVPFAFGAESIAFDLRLIIGRRWFKLLERSIGDLNSLELFRTQYVQLYPIALPDPSNDADTQQVADPEVWATLQAVAGRRMDGYLLYQHLLGGGHASDNIVDQLMLYSGLLDHLGTRLVSWFDGLIDQPAAEAAWDARRLEHRFSVAAADPTGETVLTAPEFPGGELDWHAFSIDPSGPLDGTASGPPPVNRTAFPAPVRFTGMPLSRWWAIEDGQTNFADVQPDSADLARLIFLEFALVYSNNWFQLPCDVPAGVLVRMRGLAVTDVFGQRLWITPAGAGADEDWQRWSMFTLGTRDAAPIADTRLFVPTTAPSIATGPGLEEVSLIRDENANLVWGVERTVRVPTGESRRGSEVSAEVVAQRQRLFPPQQPTDPTAAAAYAVMSTIPENWIPFIPVHVPGDTRSVQLQRATLPSVVDGQPVHPRTSLLREGLDNGARYFINEEEVTQTGTTLRVAYNRARCRQGSVAVWLSAARGIGRCSGSSGLRFDFLADTQPS